VPAAAQEHCPKVQVNGSVKRKLTRTTPELLRRSILMSAGSTVGKTMEAVTHKTTSIGPPQAIGDRGCQ
jgi:hypothetical protein